VILNVFTVTGIFLAATGAVLALVAVAVAVRVLAARDREAAADRLHLLTLIVAVLALVRAIAWPHFYYMLESWVPALAPQGVMCAYGVTRLRPEMVAALEWGKPALLALLAGWWALAWIERRAGRPLFGRTRAAAAIPLALLAAGDCVLGVAWIAADKLEQPVTCCSQSAGPGSVPIASSTLPFARGGAAALEVALYVALGLLAAALAWRRSRATAGRAPWSWLVAALALAHLYFAGGAWLDAVAPRVLGLPYHHCVYEVVTRAPAMGLAAALTIAGSVGLLGAALLGFVRRCAPDAVDSVTRSIERGSAHALLGALAIVAVHVA
jgi:hypothetical protein